MLGPIIMSVVKKAAPTFSQMLGREAIKTAVNAAAHVVGTAAATGAIYYATKKAYQNRSAVIATKPERY